MKRLLSILLVVLVLFATTIVLAEDASFTISNNSTSSWSSADKAVYSIGTGFKLSFGTVTNHGVGRGWIDGTSDYATSKYTYNSSYSNTTTSEKDYCTAANNGKKKVIWKMRRDSDYSGTFGAKGTFKP